MLTKAFFNQMKTMPARQAFGLLYQYVSFKGSLDTPMVLAVDPHVEAVLAEDSHIPTSNLELMMEHSSLMKFVEAFVSEDSARVPMTILTSVRAEDFKIKEEAEEEDFKIKEEAEEAKEGAKKRKADEEAVPPDSRVSKCPRVTLGHPPCSYCRQDEGSNDSSDDSSDEEEEKPHWAPRPGTPWAQQEPASPTTPSSPTSPISPPSSPVALPLARLLAPLPVVQATVPILQPFAPPTLPSSPPLPPVPSQQEQPTMPLVPAMSGIPLRICLNFTTMGPATATITALA